MTYNAAARIRALLVRNPGIFSNQERADLRTLVDEHADDFTWEEWAVQVHFPGGLTSVDHVDEHEARLHLERLNAEQPQRAGRIELVRRVNIQGTWRVVGNDDA